MDRRINATKRDRAGRITALCNAGQSWSPRRTEDVLRDIAAGKKSYYVQQQRDRRYVRIVDGALSTTLDTADPNHLESLPEASGGTATAKSTAADAPQARRRSASARKKK